MTAGTFGLHVINYPSGRYGYAGSVPFALCEYVPADRSAMLGGRAERDSAGNFVELRVRVFATREDAVGFAQVRGYEVTP